jgi:hypothetical protein
MGSQRHLLRHTHGYASKIVAQHLVHCLCVVNYYFSNGLEESKALPDELLGEY